MSISSLRYNRCLFLIGLILLVAFVLVGKFESISEASTTRKMYTGYLDANGDATVSVPEIILNDMPVVVGYVYSIAYAEPGYVALGNIITSTGTFKYSTGASNANHPYILVTDNGEVTPTYYIKGYIKDSGGTGISGVTVTLSGTKSGNYVTDSTGFYQFLGLINGNYNVIPNKNNVGFSPASRDYTNLFQNQENENFIGTPVKVDSGQVIIVGGRNGYIQPSKNEEAKIKINPKTSGTISIKIYTLRGELVWEKEITVIQDVQEVVSWACKNLDNEVVASGIYLVYIKGTELNLKKKIAIIK